PRHGTILISWLDGQMALIVTQTSCRYFPTPASLAVLAGGGTFIYSPSSSGNCRLPSPSTDVEWLSARRSGNISLTVFVEANSSTASRSGTVSLSWNGGG